MISGIIGVIAFVVTIYGIYRCFVAHILLGILAILFPPIGLICGVLKIFNYDAPEQFMVWWRSGRTDQD